MYVKFFPAGRREMGELNNVLKVYMSKPERIQSVLEYFIGERLSENWSATCVEEDGFFSVENTKGRVSFRQRDILKKVVTEEGAYFLGIENQARINLIFPWRLMQMDSLFYERQIEEIRRKNMEEAATYTQEDDYQYRFKKRDRLIPIVNLVLYWGKTEWKCPTGLSDMTDGRLLPEKM